MTSRPSAKQAIKIIRRWRVKRTKPVGSADALFDRLSAVIEDFHAEHPETPLAAVQEVLETLLGLYDDEDLWRDCSAKGD
jgi:hypothetical protein